MCCAVPTAPSLDRVTPDTPLRLSVAAALAFPDGSMRQGCTPDRGALMTVKYLTAEEVSERYRGEITVGTLRNWRAMRIGPPFIKIGKAVLYPIEELDAWDKASMVTCRAKIQPQSGS